MLQVFIRYNCIPVMKGFPKLKPLISDVVMLLQVGKHGIDDLLLSHYQ
ncbi:hypothetical protein [Scytonema sp. NUACC21]